MSIWRRWLSITRVSIILVMGQICTLLTSLLQEIKAQICKISESLHSLNIHRHTAHFHQQDRRCFRADYQNTKTRIPALVLESQREQQFHQEKERKTALMHILLIKEGGRHRQSIKALRRE